MKTRVKRVLFWAAWAVSSIAFQTLSHQAQATEVGYDKGFYLMSDDKNYRFKFNLQVQPRYEYQLKEAAIDVNTFRMARLRTVFSGNAFSPKFKYFFTVEYSDTAGSVNLRDGEVDLKLADYFIITVGQFNLPINREDLYSGIGGQLVRISLMYDEFGLDRDLGIQFSGNIIKPVGYYLFVVNGDGRNLLNRNKEVMIGSRLEYNIMGQISPFQGDLEHSENPNLSFGDTVAYDFGSASETEDFTTLTGQGINPREDKLVRNEVDGTFTWLGFSLLGEWSFVYDNQFRSFDHGFVTQSGYFLIPKKFEVASRYSVVYPDFPIPAESLTGLTSKASKGSEIGGIPIREVTAGLNYYIRGHFMKVQTAYTILMNRGGFRNLNDQIIRAQLTLVF